MSTNRGVHEVAFFGYGSLVNELTLAGKYSVQPAKIKNWTREWRHCVETPFGRVCALTVSREENALLEGVFITCQDFELVQFDEREIGYRRVELFRIDTVSENLNLPERIYIYTSTPTFHRAGDSQYPIWMSYVEVVVNGYLRLFGEAGVDRFIHSTRGWSTPMLDDRQNPRYPRAMQLSDASRKLIEDKLRTMKELKLFQA